MKKSLLLLTCFLCMFLTHVSAQQYYMSAPEGYGAGTTGGGNATPTTVTTYDDMKTALGKTGAAVILVSGTITIPSGGMIKVAAKDKTLLGLPGATLINTDRTKEGSGILYLNTGSSNVIIRNLIFKGPGAYDVDGNDNLTIKPVTGLWVDHCEFQDGMDGNFDMTGLSDNITVSWCKFTYLIPPLAGGSGGSNDHRFSDLVGGNASDFPADGHYSITFQNCYWAEGCVERMPRARNAELHILNCYYNTSAPKSLAIGIGGGDNNSTCYVENTNFAKVASVFQEYTADGGTVGINFSNCLGGANNQGSVSAPSYNYTAYAVSEVATVVPNADCGAGATLKITSVGAISSSCAVTAVLDEKISSVQVYPNPTGAADMLTIQGSETIQSISIINARGVEIGINDNISAMVYQASIGSLEEGLYALKIQYISGQSETKKFVKSR